MAGDAEEGLVVSSANVEGNDRVERGSNSSTGERDVEESSRIKSAAYLHKKII